MAVLNLKGKFCELNPAFSKLVGYQEHEFLKAVWPSVHDRAVYKEQTEQLGAAQDAASSRRSSSSPPTCTRRA